MNPTPTHEVFLDGAGLTPQFWDHFVREYWGQKPVIFRNAFKTPVISPEALFEVLLTAAGRMATRNKYAPGQKRARMSFYGDGFNMQVHEDYRKMLPLRSDGGFAGYEARLQRELGTRQWAVFLNTIHPYAVDLWRAARDMMHDLFSRVGSPAGRVGIESFMGPYDSTPFGIHKDQAHIFTLPVLGRKNIRLWPYQDIARYLALGETEVDLVTSIKSPFRTEPPAGGPALELRAGVGDMTYWPPSYWHIVEGRGDMNAAVTIGMEMTGDPLDLVNGLTSRLAAEVPQPLRPLAGGDFQASARRHKQIRKAAAVHARNLLHAARSEAVRDMLDRQDSALMFDRHIEPLDGVELHPTDEVELDTRYPIIVRRKKNTLACFMNGHMVLLARGPAMQKLLRLLNKGGRRGVAALVAKTIQWSLAEPSPMEEQNVLDVLNILVSHHALRQYPSR